MRRCEDSPVLAAPAETDNAGTDGWTGLSAEAETDNAGTGREVAISSGLLWLFVGFRLETVARAQVLKRAVVASCRA